MTSRTYQPVLTRGEALLGSALGILALILLILGGF